MANIISEYKAMQVLNCTRRDLARWRKEGMPYMRQGGHLVYDLDKLHRWFRGEEFTQASGNPRTGLLPESWREIPC